MLYIFVDRSRCYCQVYTSFDKRDVEYINTNMDIFKDAIETGQRTKKLVLRRSGSNLSFSLSLSLSIEIPEPSADMYENVMRINQIIVQALWVPFQPLLQLPHVENEHLRYFITRKVRHKSQLSCDYHVTYTIASHRYYRRVLFLKK